MNTNVTTSTRFRWAASDRYSLLKDFAKQNRKNATTAENVLWEHIRGKLLGAEFRRQHIISDFIVDFVCLDKNLIIEVDGGYHSEKEQKEDDEFRTKQLNKLGFNVIRFQNEEILYETEKVLQKIKSSI